MLAGTALTKRYGATTALRGADLTLRAGAVHGLLGENGAGKSTVVKILTGALRPDGGTVTLDGSPVRLAGTAEAVRRGIALVSQELNLFGELDVLSNVCSFGLPRRGPLVSRRRMAELARPVLAELGLRLDPRRPVADLSLAERQLVEIARALVTGPRVLVLDEPTSALQPGETHRLHEVLDRLRNRGVALCYVSHVLEDVLAVCDEVTVLRDGAVVLAAARTGTLSVPALVRAMLGGDATNGGAAPAGTTRRTRAGGPAGKPAGAFRLCGVGVPGRLHDVTVEVAPGEIVGLAGLDGSGHRDVLAVAAGLLRPRRGHVELPDGTRPPPGVRAAVRHGIGLVSGDRARLGLMVDKPLWENAVQVRSVGAGRDGWLLPAGRLRGLARDAMDRLGVRAASADQRADQLSGGNQQKVVFAKWLLAGPTVLLMDDPARGIDVAARARVHELLGELAAGGVAQLLVSSDPWELAEVCDRVVVIHRGRVGGVLAGDVLRPHAILEAVNGEVG